MTTRTDELAAFKTLINLTEYAASCGYELDRRATSRNSAAMAHSNGDKVIIARDGDTWVYFSVRDPADHGTIIDFIQHRRRLNLGQVRRELRPWLDLAAPLPRPHSSAFVQRLEPVVKDLAAVRSRYNAAECVVGFHPYLSARRSIPPAVLASERFADRIRTDAHGNALFPHWSTDGLCGYEIRGPTFKGFSKHGEKGLWGSRTREQDRALVIAESAVSALSYAAIAGLDRARFVSTAGQMNPSQPGLLNQAMRKMPEAGEIIAAVDHDGGGDAIAEAIELIFHNVHDMFGRRDLRFRVDRPAQADTDWNDELCAGPALWPEPEPE